MIVTDEPDLSPVNDANPIARQLLEVVVHAWQTVDSARELGYDDVERDVVKLVDDAVAKLVTAVGVHKRRGKVQRATIGVMSTSQHRNNKCAVNENYFILQ